MARARNIKHGFFTNDLLGMATPIVRLMFAGLWLVADREGRLEDRPKRIKAEILPYDEGDPELWLAELASLGFILRYEVEGRRFIQCVNFTKHQNPHHKEAASLIPPPPGQEASSRLPYDVSAELRAAVFKRDNHECLRCSAAERLEIDHIIPLSKGGDNAITNLQTLCKTCNSSKRDAIKSYVRLVVESSMTQPQRKHDASCPSDSGFLIPDSLIPDVRIPDSSVVAPSTPRGSPQSVDNSVDNLEKLRQEIFVKDVATIHRHKAKQVLQEWPEWRTDDLALSSVAKSLGIKRSRLAEGTEKRRVIGIIRKIFHPEEPP